MDDENGSSSGFNISKNMSILFTSLVDIIFKRLDEQENFDRTYKFNTSCTSEMQCDATEMFCNATTNRCQCSLFHFWNKTVGICEYQHKYMIKWLEENGKKMDDDPLLKQSDPLESESRYNIPLNVTIIMVIGAMCYLFCVAYICFGQDKIDEDKSLYTALRKQKEQSCKIQTSIIEHI